ncbi:Fic family protein [Engelhardtia mirabilis]|uniref:Fic family protein n=1 Tax=Engelhardtia mirabilis TaxID=2528011 RepID=UPI00119F7046
MPYIHQHPDWPRFTWSAEALANRLAAVRHRQGVHLGRMQALGFDLRAEANLEVLATEVVKSWAIEGEAIDRDEVRSSLAERLGLELAGLPRPSRAIEGVVAMMLDATRDFSRPLTAERLFGWHAALFPTGRSGLDPITVAAWRPESAGAMQVISGRVGRERVHFEAPAADRLAGEMAAFLDWFEGGDDVDPVLRAGLAHLWFVTIHPFEDGNGRIARAIGDLVLARADRTGQRFYSLSAQIEAERGDYYRELERAQRGGLDVTAWLEWFLDILERAIAASDGTLERVLRKGRLWQRVGDRSLNQRQRRVLERVLDVFEGKLTSSKYAKLAKCSADTAQRDIRDLLERGLLARNEGAGRSTSYRVPDDV